MKSSRDHAMADEMAIAADESSAILVRHVSMACSGTWNNRVGTRGGIGGRGAVASSVRTQKLPCEPKGGGEGGGVSVLFREVHWI